jgi:hypothetical protein
MGNTNKQLRDVVSIKRKVDTIRGRISCITYKKICMNN